MKFPLLRTLCAGIVLSSAISTAHAAMISGQGTWETTLQGRDLDGNLFTSEAYYDTSLNITWLANANYAGTTMTWANANTWAAGLNPYGSGISGWRLPTTIDVGNDGATYTNIYQGVDYGYNITTPSEMSHMFYTTLGDKAYCSTSGSCPQAGWGLTNTGPFSNVNVQSFGYWSATEYALYTDDAWDFNTDYGYQSTNLKANSMYVWAVHAGDVGASTVPVPAAVWLFSSGLLGLLGVSGKRRR